MHRRPHAIWTALLLLIAGALSIGGPIAVHHLTGHQGEAEHTHVCGAHTTDAAHSLPAGDPFPDQHQSDCPECDLLTTLAVADIASATAIIESNQDRSETVLTLAAPSASADRAPRSSRGPPAA